MTFSHITDALKMPQIVRIAPNLYVARFETMKVYSALQAVQHLLDVRKINHNTTLLDSSSGIYAYALALACHRFKLKCYIIASKTVDQTLMSQLRVLGATVEQVPPEATLKLDQSRRVERIHQLLSDNPDFYWMQQYHDDVHYLAYSDVAHYVAEQVGIDQLTIVGSIGTGCSTGGLITKLRQFNHDTRLIGIQPFGSVTFGAEHVDDPGIIIAGIGSSIPFKNVKHHLYDELHWISFSYALSGSIALLSDHAIFAGLSAGCCYLVANREAQLHPDRKIIFITADTGHRYVDRVFANYTDAEPIDQLEPRRITHLDELALPWTCMDWSRQSLTDHDLIAV